jgi:choice-of-anchor C domain-containing protein
LLTPLVAFFVGAQTAEANVLVNGSFEEGSMCETFRNPGSTNIPGWTPVGAAVFYICSSWLGAEGVRSISLHCGGGIAQTFATEPGRDYLVRFDMAGDPDVSPVIKNLVASTGGSPHAFSFDSEGKTRLAMGWDEKRFVFTASDTTTTLTFVDIGCTRSAIDDVHVTPFPSDDLPAVDLTLTGCGSESGPCDEGNQFTVQAHWTNIGSTSVPAEVKIGFRLPDGTPVNVVGDIHLVFPFPAGLDVTAPLLNFAWPGGRPPGTWTVEATLLGPPLGEIFSRSVRMFAVGP